MPRGSTRRTEQTGCPSSPGPTAVSETVAPAVARSPQKTRIGVCALRASASSLSVPVSRAIWTLERESESACSSSQISRARTQPCHSQRNRSSAEARSPESRSTASPAARHCGVVVVGKGDQRVQQQVGGGRLGIRWPRRGARGFRDLRESDAAVEPGAEQRRGERVHVGLAREPRCRVARGGGRRPAEARSRRCPGSRRMRAGPAAGRPARAGTLRAAPPPPWPAGGEPR